MANCNKVKNTCGSRMKATCTDFEGSTNSQSELAEEGCLDIEQTTQDIYNQLEEVHEQIDLSALGEQCLTYVLTDEGKIIVKNALLAFETKICELEERIEELENRQLCDFPISGCDLDLVCLELPCEQTILTLSDWMQAVTNKICEE